jgi:hypothetical protein
MGLNLGSISQHLLSLPSKPSKGILVHTSGRATFTLQGKVSGKWVKFRGRGHGLEEGGTGTGEGTVGTGRGREKEAGECGRGHSKGKGDRLKETKQEAWRGD